jgi:hypothetical protein
VLACRRAPCSKRPRGRAPAPRSARREALVLAATGPYRCEPRDGPRRRPCGLDAEA